jgi:hypothetical protein
MTFEEVKAAIESLSAPDNRRLVKEVAMPLCCELMADAEFREGMAGQWMDVMDRMRETVRQRMEQFLETTGRGRRS